MSIEKIVRETLKLTDHKILNIEMTDESIDIYLDKKVLRRLPCRNCSRRCRCRDQLPPRIWTHVSLWGIPVCLVYSPRRVKCPSCGIIVEKIPWSMGKSRLTLPLIITLAFFARLLAIDQVANLYRVSWGTVSNAVKKAVKFGIHNRDCSNIQYIGIDEISRKKGHVYHTNIYDLDKKVLIWSGEGRTMDTLRQFFDEMGKEFTSNLKGICCDMWKPYISVVKERVPNAVLVFDKFHLIRYLLNAVDKVRKDEVKRYKQLGKENILKKTKYIWLKNPCNLTSNQEQSLGYIQKLNTRVTRAYLLKESFRELWKHRSKEKAKKYMKKWFWWATHSRLKPLRDFAWLLRRHEEDILSWFEVRIDNGATEAMNNNAKAISHRARGYRTSDMFSMVMLHCLGGLKLPEFLHKFV